MHNNNNNYVLIMAGGIGSRFWPASREKMPKQFLDILGIGKSLIRMTFERVLPLVPADQILIATNKRYKGLVQEHLPEVPEKNILLEPSRNNTAPCIAYAGLKIHGRDKNACLAVLPSDHVILKEDDFLDKLRHAFGFAAAGDHIVTLGLEPTRPDTGYGYIQKGDEMHHETGSPLFKVTSFREKPDLQTAKQYLEDGNYLWNAGIFIWKLDTFLKALEKNEPEILRVLNESPESFDAEGEQDYVDRVYPNTPNISVDYAVLERADNVYTIPADIGWSDLGTWNALYAYLDKDANNSVVLGDNTILIDSHHTIVRTPSDKIVVIKGLENFMVIDEEDALLIYPKDHEQEIKQIRKDLPGEYV